jgi:integrase
MGIYKPTTSRYWWGRYQFQGQRQFINLGVTYLGKAADRKLAEAAYHQKRQEFINALERGQETNPRLTLKELFAEYMALHSKPNKRSWTDDEAVLKRFLGYYGESALAKRVTAHSLEVYKTERLKPNKKGWTVSHARVNRELAILKSVFSKGVLWGKVSDNPVKRVTMFREDNKRERILTPEEKTELLKHSPDWLRPVLVMALNTGMRQGEILSLKWADVNLSQKVLFIRQAKSGKPRHVPINSTLAEMLKRHPKRGAWVFADENGNMLDRHGAVRSSFDKLVRDLALTDFRFHDLRHTFASELAMKGVDLLTIAQLLGHSSTRMTERYAHLSPNHKRVAVEMLAAQNSPRSENTVRISGGGQN